MIDSNRGVARALIGFDEYNELRSKGVLATDDRRRRPLWFDGRFLDAAALNSEQNYILGRQADIARVAGIGVVTGLQVSRTEDRARAVTISAGHGITPGGELVMLNEAINVDLADVPEIQKLDASFGLSKQAKSSPINRSGLFILALRPVEFTAHPVASYPTSINASRQVEDGNIVEATAITLIPYPDQSARLELNERRKHVANEVFLQSNQMGQPSGVLPLAMIALNLGVIQWLDVFMVRREVGALDHDVFGLGLSPRALREAYLHQYHNHLQELLDQNQSASAGFSASEHFTALPAAGPMPAGAVNASDFSQTFFPAEIDVELSIIADDELPALIEDSYTLPPLDLTLDADSQESTSILVVIPMPRHRMRQLFLSLENLTRRLPAAAPGMVSKRKPITALQNLIRRPSLISAQPVTTPAEEAWRNVLNGVETLWYIRRRNVSYKEQVVANSLMVKRDEIQIENSINDQFRNLGLTTTIGNIRRRGTSAAEAELIKMFSSPVFMEGSSISVKAAVNEINNLEKVDSASLIAINERYTAKQFGEGVARLEFANPTLASNRKKMDIVAGSGLLPELDEVAKVLPPKEFAVFSEKLGAAATGNDASSEKVASLITEKLATLNETPITLARKREVEAQLLMTGRSSTSTTPKLAITK